MKMIYLYAIHTTLLKFPQKTNIHLWELQYDSSLYGAWLFAQRYCDSSWLPNRLVMLFQSMVKIARIITREVLSSFLEHNLNMD